MGGILLVLIKLKLCTSEHFFSLLRSAKFLFYFSFVSVARSVLLVSQSHVQKSNNKEYIGFSKTGWKIQVHILARFLFILYFPKYPNPLYI